MLGRLLWRTGLSAWFVREMPRGFRIRFYPSSISAALWSDPTSRTEDEDFVWAVLRPGDRYIDAGANIGQLALAASQRVGPAGEVVAIEAHPEIHGYLEGNVALNETRNLRTLNYALGASPGEVAMTSRRSDDQNFVTEDGPLRVPLRALDELVAARPTRLLKLDVEGYELPVLQGALRTLRETDIVYCELSTGNCRRFGYQPQEVEQLLVGQGFVFIRTGAGGEATVTASPYFASLPTESLPATGYNLVAVRPGVAQEVLQMLAARGPAAP
jgi:FkbM family methyltransferase